MSVYIESYDGETKWTYFSIEGVELLKYIMIFGMESAIV